MLILLSGPIAVGKTTVATGVADALGYSRLSVRSALADVLSVGERDRVSFQRLGADLDQRTGGRWLVDYLIEHEASSTVVDSLRTRRQTAPILETFTDSRLVYLSAHEETRRRRYQDAARADDMKRGVAYEVAMVHGTELRVADLRPLAHLEVETDDLSAQETVDVIVTSLQ